MWFIWCCAPDMSKIQSLLRWNKILAQAQDHTAAAPSWLGACELMSGHAIWYRFFSFPSFAATGDEKDNPLVLDSGWIISLKCCWLASITVIWDWQKHRCYQFDSWRPKNVYFMLHFSPIFVSLWVLTVFGLVEVMVEIPHLSGGHKENPLLERSQGSWNPFGVPCVIRGWTSVV